MGRVARFLSATILAVAIVVATAWAGLALWYRLPVSELWRGLAVGLLVLLALAAIVALFAGLRFRVPTAFAGAFGAVLIWWSTIVPPDHANWAPDVARQVTGTMNGDMLTLTDVRISSGAATPISPSDGRRAPTTCPGYGPSTSSCPTGPDRTWRMSS